MSEYLRRLAFKAGEKAARQGRPGSVCNRQRGTIFFDDWHDGYEQALNSQPARRAGGQHS
jgi:hypothetical protein